MTEIKKNIFSGHESFQCRSLWLKKGYDFLNKGKSFNDNDAVVELGVGKNMVNSIRYWMRAFDLTDSEDNLTQFATLLLSDSGWDPFLEDEASLWLLHFHLVSKDYATTYNLIFNELRKSKIEFNKTNFLTFIKRKLETFGVTTPSENTLKLDFDIFVRLYLRSNIQATDKEEGSTGILTEIDLLRNFYRENVEYLTVDVTEKNSIPPELILYGILHQTGKDLSIDFSYIEQGYNSIGNIFAINKNGLVDKINAIVQQYPNEIVFSDHSGVKQLQFKTKDLDLYKVLDKYYSAIYAG